MRFDGYNGQVTLHEQTLVITRNGLAARAAFGKDTPEREIPLQAVSGVRVQEATRLKNGWIQLLLGGESPPELSAGTATSDPNTVLFAHGKRLQLQDLHDRVAAIVAQNATDGVDPAGIEFDDGSDHAGRGTKVTAKLEARKAAIEARTAAIEVRREELQGRLDAQHPAKAVSSSPDGNSALRPDIEEASARMGWKLGGKREITRLEEHLHAGEEVRFIAQGVYETNQGIVVLTTERLIFVFHGILKQAVEDFPLDKLSSVQSKVGMVSGELTIHASGNSAVIKNIVKADLKFLAGALRERIATKQEVPSVASAPVIDVADQLAKFAALRDQGVISEEEFVAQKQKLLG